MADDFAPWLRLEFKNLGPFTAMIVLVELDATTIWPVGSSYANVIGDEWQWRDMRALLERSGLKWSAVVLFAARRAAGGPLTATEARARLAETEKRVIADHLTLNQGIFLDRQGRQLKLEEMRA